MSEQGVNIPKEYLQGVDIVDIRLEQNVVIVTPVDADPIWKLGTAPVSTDVKDASLNHDKYIYSK
ncbi:MAG: hypothetical protein LGR52_14650 [Candidatus Thiosymbion ectosymbiont of Robbea hypermnestra]|nr:hypothetical protein [Candidatus Thiosymbion ectosymbiont of Robbea hypermnestra]